MKPAGTHEKAPKPSSATDRRILRTRDTLGDALFALMQEKSFDEITVQEVLDRAGVGRSTFYAHYRDKDDLFLSDLEDFLEKISTLLKRNNASRERLLPVRELLTHIREAPQIYASIVRSEKLTDLQTLGRGLFARSIEERLQTGGVEIEPVRRSAQAYALAGSFFSLLEWWIDKGMKADPQQMEELFHQMAWSGLPCQRP